jgi:cytochrome c5
VKTLPAASPHIAPPFYFFAGTFGVVQAAHVSDPDSVFDEVSRDDASSVVDNTCLQCHGAGVMCAANVDPDNERARGQTLADDRGHESLMENVIRGRGAWRAAAWRRQLPERNRLESAYSDWC